MTKVKSLIFIVLPAIILAIVGASLLFVGMSKNDPKNTDAASLSITFHPDGSRLSIGHNPNSSIGSGTSDFTVSATEGSTLYYEVSPKSGTYYYCLMAGQGYATSVGYDSLSGTFPAKYTSYRVDTYTTYTVSASSNNTSLGTVSGGGTVNYGKSTTLTATPVGDAVFNYWKDDKGNKKTTKTITVTARSTKLYSEACQVWTAYFGEQEKTTYTLSAHYYRTSGPQVFKGTDYGSVGFTSSCGKAEISQETTASSIRCYAKAKSGYELQGWYSDHPSGWMNLTGYVSSSTTYVNSRYTELYAVFRLATYDLYIDPNGGTYDGSSGTVYIATGYDGTTATIEYTPSRTGYSFNGWSKSGYGSVSGSTFTFGAGDCTLIAQWTPLTGTLNIDPNGGTYAGSTGTTVITGNYGTSITLETPTRDGYSFTRWSIAGSSGSLSGSTYTFGSGTARVTAQWTEASYQVTFIFSGRCMITGPTKIGAGSSAEFTITVDLGYLITWYVEQGSNTTHSLNLDQSTPADLNGASYTSVFDRKKNIVTLTLTNVTRYISLSVTASHVLAISNLDTTNITDIEAYRAESATTATLSANFASGTVPEMTFNSGTPVKLVTASGKGKVNAMQFSYTFANNVLSISLSNITASSVPTIKFNTDKATVSYTMTSNNVGSYSVSSEYLHNGQLLLTVLLAENTKVVGLKAGSEEFYFGTARKYFAPVANAHNLFIDNNQITGTLYITIDINQPLKTSTSTTYVDLSLILIEE